ncbi:hypothetical protein A2U01_0111175, partial [Trifolium medium]|nr:hypothetical protein [Trifolium medium]
YTTPLRFTGTEEEHTGEIISDPGTINYETLQQHS